MLMKKNWKFFTMKNLFIILFSVSVPFLILLDNTKQAIVYEGYENILNETGAFDRVDNVKEINSQIVGFIIGTNQEFSALTPREKKHMEDVRWVVANGYAVYLILMLVAFVSFFVIITKYGFDTASNALMIAAVVSLSKLILLSMIDFSALFTFIHGLIFEQGSWLFSSSDLLIRLYSFEFFRQISMKIASATAIQAVVLFVFGFMFKGVEKRIF